MTTLYLVRHAEAEGNLYRISQGHYDSLITARGLWQIEALSARFADIPIDAVYASDLFRTSLTAGAVCLPKHLPLHRRADLREIGVGVWEQMSWGEILREDPRGMVAFNRHLDQWQVAGGESGQQVLDRVLVAVTSIAAAHDGQTAAVFSHGYAIRILLAALEGRTMAELGQTPYGDNTAVSKLEYEDGRFRILYRDDSSHLKKALAAASGQVWREQANGVEAGLAFDPADLPAQGEFLKTCLAADWPTEGGNTPWDPTRLLRDAASRPTLTASLEGRPAGIIQFAPDRGASEKRGWITLYAMAEPFRRQGLGVQLLGQAVKFYRPLGRETLCLALRPEGAAARFFTRYDFRPAEALADGRRVWTKDIGYRGAFWES